MVSDSPTRAEGFALEEFARDNVQRWSSACQQFLEWQRREVLQGQPSAKILEQHRTALKWLLRGTQAMYSTVADPDYPNRWIASELEGRLYQLRESWELVHNPMPDQEAEMLIKEVFPE